MWCCQYGAAEKVWRARRILIALCLRHQHIRQLQTSFLPFSRFINADVPAIAFLDLLYFCCSFLVPSQATYVSLIIQLHDCDIINVYRDDVECVGRAILVSSIGDAYPVGTPGFSHHFYL
ncbi:hypothetical protein K469DRAFT_397252 [Zopfia rhizophila CBS 207.26]|uniref:Uncharacterized protein n=1 Tax=Zopfia rhizophila CBS 207.26 TaxID=1314779 RepID=A0A6A6DCA9_9PEZI|nr:hypothetical protein K469DRAFT_397252 [Zopfia rhizophila CBS 207.26]